MLTRKIFCKLKITSRAFINSIYPEVPFKKETIAELIFSFCDKYSNRIACIDEATNRYYSFLDYKNGIKGVASSLTKKGILQGTRFCLIAHNCPEYHMLVYAISSIGCTIVLCNPQFTEKELLNILLDSKPSILITNEEYSKKVSNVAALTPNIKDIYLIGNQQENYSSVEDLINDSGNMCSIGHTNLDLNNHIALITYSSGTTGSPKGVMLTHNNLVSIIYQIMEMHSGDTQHRILVILPFYHIFGIGPLSAGVFPYGGTMVIQTKFDPIKYLNAIEKYKISLIHLVPPLILFFLNHPEVSKYDISSIVRCYCGGAHLSSELEDKFTKKLEAFNPKFDFYSGYGLSESTGMAILRPYGSQSYYKKGSVGVVNPNMECKIVNKSTKENVKANENGEILLKGPNIMKGYLGKINETDNTFEEGWLKTGDIGYFDDDQYIYITGRLKDLIKVKGYQVTPEELESTLLSMPGIIDCGVVGVFHERYGEVPKAFVVRTKSIEKEDINEFIAKNLSDYKQLRGGITFVDQIPKSPSGKILRNVLRAYTNS